MTTTRARSPRAPTDLRSRGGRQRLVIRQERTARLFMLYRLKQRLGVLWTMTTARPRAKRQSPASSSSSRLPVWERPTAELSQLSKSVDQVATPAAEPAAPIAPGVPVWEAATTHLSALPEAPPPDAGPSAPNGQTSTTPGKRRPTGRPTARITGRPRWDEMRLRVWEDVPTAPLELLTPEQVNQIRATVAPPSVPAIEEQPTERIASARPSGAPETQDTPSQPSLSGVRSAPGGAPENAPISPNASSAAIPALRIAPARVSPVLRDPRREGHNPSLWDRETQELPTVRRPGRPDNVFAGQQTPEGTTRLLVITSSTRAVQPQSRNARLKSLAWLAIRIVFSIALLAYLVVKTNIHQLASVIVRANPAWLALGLLVGVFTVVVSAWQWQILLRGERISLDLLSLTWLYFLGIAFNQLLPSSIGGDVAKIAYVARISRKGVSAASATVMTRIVGLGAMLLTALPVAVGAPLLIAHFWRVGWSMAALLAVALLAYLAGVGVLLAMPWLLNRLGIERAVRLPYARKALDLARSLTAYRRRPLILFWAFIASATFYAASDLNFYCYGQALGIHSPFWFYWIAIPLTSLATLAPISLNGYGVRGASFVALFVLVGESGAAALSLSTTMEVQMLLFAVVGAVVAVALQRRGSFIREAPGTVPLGESQPGKAARAGEQKQPSAPVIAYVAPAGASTHAAPERAGARFVAEMSAPVRRTSPGAGATRGEIQPTPERTGRVSRPIQAQDRSLADAPTVYLASADEAVRQDWAASPPQSAPPDERRRATGAPEAPTTRRATGWPTPLPPTLEPVGPPVAARRWTGGPADVGQSEPATNTAQPRRRYETAGPFDTPLSAAEPSAPSPIADEALADEQPTRQARPTGRPRTRETAH